MAEPNQGPDDDGRPRPYPRPHRVPETPNTQYEEPGQGGASTDNEPQDGPAPLAAKQRRPAKDTLPIGTIAAMATIVIIAAILVALASQYNLHDFVIASICVLSTVQLGLYALRKPLATAEADFREKMGTPAWVPDRVDRILAPNEKVYVVTNEHPITMTGWFAAIILIQLVGGYLAGTTDILQNGPGVGVMVALWLAAMAVPTYKVVKWRRTIFVITNKNILLFEGVFDSDHNRMPLTGLTDAKATTRFHSRWLAGLRWVRVKYGTFVLESAGQEQAINKIRSMAGIETLEYILMSLVQGDDPYPLVQEPPFDNRGPYTPYPLPQH